MDRREFFISRRKAEYPAFQRVIEALPRDRFDYRPHERSPSAGDVVWTLACETWACCQMVDEHRVDWKPPPPPAVDEILAGFARGYETLDAKVGRLGDAEWQKPCQLVVDGKVMLEQGLGDFLWYLFFDAIHHRGQLSTYIRPMGGRVPSIYGPSGDDPGLASG